MSENQDSEHETGNLAACLKSYYLESKFTDLVIETTGKSFKVHKVVVCSHSGYFLTMLNGNWVETANNTIKLENDDPLAVEAMIEFMYGIEYDSSGGQRGRMSPMMFNIEVYRTADKYDVPNLKALATRKFEDNIEVCWDLDHIPDAIVAAYTATPSTDRGLRDPLMQVIHKHIDDLMAMEEFTEVLQTQPGFAADLAKQLHSQKKNTFGCQNSTCKLTWQMTVTKGQDYYHCPFCGMGYYLVTKSQGWVSESWLVASPRQE